MTDNEVITTDLRKALKQTLKDEVLNLSETLKELEPKDRLNVVCRLLPYVFPKVDNVRFTQGEPIGKNFLDL